MRTLKKRIILSVVVFSIILLGLSSLTTYIPTKSTVGLAANTSNVPLLRITQIDTTQFPKVLAYASFTDANGDTVVGLNKNYFTVLEDNNPIYNFDVSSVRQGNKKDSIVIAIDCSYSMKDSGALEQAKSGASKFVEMMDPNDQCTIISFSRKITYRVTDGNGNPVFTSDKGTLLRAIQSIQPEPFTRLYDGIYAAIDSANNATSFRKAVIVLTDAVKEDEESTHNIDDCIAHAVRLGIPVYTIGEGADVNAPPLEKIAQETGGSYYFAANPGELFKLYQQISRNIHNEYVISYKSRMRSSDAPKTHTLTLKVNYEGNTYTASKNFIPVVIPAQYSTVGLILLIILAALVLLLAIYFIWRKNKKRCPQCGRLIDKNALVCPYCGYSFVPIPEKPIPESEPEPTIMAEDTEEEKTRVVHKGGSGFAWLTVVEGQDKGKTFELYGKDVFSIGRSAVNDVLLEDSSVSRKHAKISKKGKKYFIHDLASSNGTFVNDKRVDIAEIKDGDMIYIGDVTLIFKTVKKEG